MKLYFYRTFFINILIILFFTGNSCKKHSNELQIIEKKQITCEVFENNSKNIKFISKDFIITNDDKIYIYNNYKLYSDTNSNCKKVETNIIPIGLDGNRKIIYSTNKKSYQLLDNELVKCSNEPSDFDNYCSVTPIVKLANENNFIYLEDEIIIQNNKINKIKNYEMDNDLFIKIPDNEIIQSIYLTKNDMIVTNKTAYKLIKSSKNIEDCSKYADIDCIYELKLKEIELNNILYINYYYNKNEYSYIGRDGYVYTSKLNFTM